MGDTKIPPKAPPAPAPAPKSESDSESIDNSQFNRTELDRKVTFGVTGDIYGDISLRPNLKGFGVDLSGGVNLRDKFASGTIGGAFAEPLAYNMSLYHQLQLTAAANWADPAVRVSAAAEYKMTWQYFATPWLTLHASVGALAQVSGSIDVEQMKKDAQAAVQSAADDIKDAVRAFQDSVDAAISNRSQAVQTAVRNALTQLGADMLAARSPADAANAITTFRTRLTNALGATGTGIARDLRDAMATLESSTRGALNRAIDDWQQKTEDMAKLKFGIALDFETGLAFYIPLDDSPVAFTADVSGGLTYPVYESNDVDSPYAVGGLDPMRRTGSVVGTPGIEIDLPGTFKLGVGAGVGFKADIESQTVTPVFNSSLNLTTRWK